MKKLDIAIGGVSLAEHQATIWEYYKPRHIHAWNMLVLSWCALDENDETGFDCEYVWENFIIRLWLYRVTVNTLTRLTPVKKEAKKAIRNFDKNFDSDGKNSLKALRDMIEHFDDYAAGVGRGPAIRAKDLDPWRTITKETYERGSWKLDRDTSYQAAISLRDDAKRISESFISWFNTQKAGES